MAGEGCFHGLSIFGEANSQMIEQESSNTEPNSSRELHRVVFPTPFAF